MSEEILNVGGGIKALELGDLLSKMGKAVTETCKSCDASMSIQNGFVEARVAIHTEKTESAGASGGFSLYGVAVNGSYSRVYNYTAEASCTIRFNFAIVPVVPTT